MFELANGDRVQLTSFLQDIVRIPSVSGKEREVAERIGAEMKAVGFQDVWADQVGSIVGRLGNGHGPKLVFNGHMDTVAVGEPSSWSMDPFGGEIEDGVLYGRGATDMKGPLASLVYGVKRLVDSGQPLAGDVYVVAVVQEEPSEGCAMRALVEQEGLVPNWVVLAEPNNLTVSRGHRGRLEMQVRVKGRPAHAAMPQKGLNAVYGAARSIFALEMMADSLAEDPFLGKGSLAVTGISSTAASRNVIPDSCTFVIDRRLTLGETEAKAWAEVQGVIAHEGLAADVSVSNFEHVSYKGHVCRGVEHYPAWVLPENHDLVQAGIRAIRRVTGERPSVGRWEFSTDGAYTMGAAGIPTIGIGPGMECDAHTADEHIRLSDCFTAAQVYAQLAADLLGAG